MIPAQWAASQILSYHVAWLCLFLIVTSVAACRWRLRGLVVAHILIAMIVIGLDLYWIEMAMSARGWNGSPDADIFFSFGVAIRILLINSLLLPVGIAAILFARRQRINEIFFSPLPPNSPRKQSRQR